MKKILLVIFIIPSLCIGSFPDAIGKNGVVVSSNKYASEIGIQILQDGGNAIDAAIAVGFALGVTFPNAGNIGGGGFMVIRFSNGQVSTIDFREVAPLLSDRDMFLDDSSRVIIGKSQLNKFIKITKAGFYESMVHNVVSSKDGFNF